MKHTYKSSSTSVVSAFFYFQNFALNIHPIGPSQIGFPVLWFESNKLWDRTVLKSQGIFRKIHWRYGSWNDSCSFAASTLDWLVVEPTHLKNMNVKLGSSSPSRGEKKNVWNHHLVDVVGKDPTTILQEIMKPAGPQHGRKMRHVDRPTGLEQAGGKQITKHDFQISMGKNDMSKINQKSWKFQKQIVNFIVLLPLETLIRRVKSPSQRLLSVTWNRNMSFSTLWSHRLMYCSAQIRHLHPD